MEKRRGRPPKPEQERLDARLQLRISPDMRYRIRVAAAKANVTLSEWALAAFDEKLSRDAATPDGSPL